MFPNMEVLDSFSTLIVKALGLLTSHYNSSLIKALATIYPEHKWIPWKFGRVPRGFWSRKDFYLGM